MTEDDEDMTHDVPALQADPDGCPVMVGMAHNATQDVLVCNRPMPCWMHPTGENTAAEKLGPGPWCPDCRLDHETFHTPDGSSP